MVNGPQNIGWFAQNIIAEDKEKKVSGEVKEYGRVEPEKRIGKRIGKFQSLQELIKKDACIGKDDDGFGEYRKCIHLAQGMKAGSVQNGKNKE